MTDYWDPTTFCNFVRIAAPCSEPVLLTQGTDAFKHMQASRQNAALGATVIALTASSQAPQTVVQMGVFGGFDIATHVGWRPQRPLPLPNSHGRLRDFCSIDCLHETGGVGVLVAF